MDDHLVAAVEDQYGEFKESPVRISAETELRHRARVRFGCGEDV